MDFVKNCAGVCANCGEKLGHYDTKRIDQKTGKFYCPASECFEALFLSWRHRNHMELEKQMMADGIFYYTDG